MAPFAFKPQSIIVDLVYSMPFQTLLPTGVLYSVQAKANLAFHPSVYQCRLGRQRQVCFIL